MIPQDVEAKARQEAELRKKYRHITIAQDLVMAARGKLIDRNWKRTFKPLSTSQNSQFNGTAAPEVLPATIDDISVFVIPILSYKQENLAWKAEKLAAKSTAQSTAQETDGAAAGSRESATHPLTPSNFDIDKFEAEMDTGGGGTSPPPGGERIKVEEGVEAVEQSSKGAEEESSQETKSADPIEDEDTVEH